ncbi:hypothetical protein D3C77_581030 [compost metagenome]
MLMKLINRLLHCGSSVPLDQKSLPALRFIRTKDIFYIERSHAGAGAVVSSIHDYLDRVLAFFEQLKANPLVEGDQAH